MVMIFRNLRNTVVSCFVGLVKNRATSHRTGNTINENPGNSVITMSYIAYHGSDLRD